MLEVKNLVKVYKTKGGVETRALDGVTVNFPETGLVFLLGKSGSGKSTLLNMIGGLDRPDSGEIIVKGRSSKDFSQSDFDSYRNTFIGFIFQEYNVLNEFNVEQNISLALQLQGKKNDKEAINALLKEVDLEGFNRRKPNTLSGGQKQRIAIARALIKSPEIIMADEPTGALDSNTGKQVLETLKKLSKDKLVIIVSHDQDFAEEYGDRIIELKDGKILSDKTKEHVPPKEVNKNIQLINGNIIDIKKGSELTEADFKQIYQLIKKQDKEVLISTGDNNIAVTKKAQRISDDGKGEVFKDTKGVDVKQYDGKQTKFIRSHLPFSRSFKMGASGLKTKPVRLIFTILLSVVSFTMFGVASTLMLYDSSYSLSKAMATMKRQDEAVGKKYELTSTYVRINNRTGEVENNGDPYTNSYYTYFGEQELKNLNSSNGNKFMGVFNFQDFTYNSQFQRDERAFSIQNVEVTSDKKDFYAYNYFTGLSDAEASYFSANGYRLTGEHPKEANEIAVSNYHYELLKESGALGTISNENNLIGKSINVTFRTKNYQTLNLKMKITGVYNFGETSADYNDLKDKKADSVSDRVRTALVQSFEDYIIGSHYTTGYVSPEFYKTYGFVYQGNDAPSADPVYLNGYQYNNTKDIENWDVPYDMGTSIYLQEDIDKVEVTYYDLDFNKLDSKITLKDNEVLLSYRRYQRDDGNESRQYWEPTYSKRDVLSMMRNYDEDLNDLMMDMEMETPTTEIGQAFTRMRQYFEGSGKGGSSGEYPEGYTLEKDFTDVNAAFSVLFDKAYAKHYLYQVGNCLWPLELPNFEEKVQEYLVKIENRTITDEELETLEDNLLEYFEEDPTRKYAIVYAMGATFYNDIPQSYRWNYIDNKCQEIAGKDYNEVYNDVYNSRGSSESVATLKAVLEDCYKFVYKKDITSYELDTGFLSSLDFPIKNQLAITIKTAMATLDN